jgi:hypothetical protein
VTLPGFAGEEYLPLPRSKGGAFPFLLTLGGCPTASATSLRDNGVYWRVRKLHKRVLLQMKYRISIIGFVWAENGTPSISKS